MSVPKSIVGAVLAAVYLVIAVWVAIEDLHSGGGFFNLRGLATYLVTFPVSFPFFKLLAIIGADESRFSIPLKYSLANVTMLAAFISVCTALVYVLGTVIEFGFRKLMIGQR
jgi:hypothetical protein